TTLTDLASAPAAVRRAAARAAARSALVVPLRLGDAVGTLELYRSGTPFAPAERLAAELAAAHVVLVQRSFPTASHAAAVPRPGLELAGEALAAALGEPHAAAEVVRVAANVVGAAVGLLWEDDGGGALRLTASHGLMPDAEVDAARALAQRALDASGPIHAVEAEGLPGGCGVSTSLPLGQPPVGALQLLYAPGDRPDAEQLGRLATFGVRAARALRA